MARPKKQIPSYQLHKSSGHARTVINGREFFLGPYGSEESTRRYGQLIAQHVGGVPIDPFAVSNLGNSLETPADPGPTVTVLCGAFNKHAEKHYQKNGKQTSEVLILRCLVRVLVQLYGDLPAKDFGPLALGAVQAALIAGDPDAKDLSGKPCPRKPWSREVINQGMSRIRRIFKFGISHQMFDAVVLTRLQTLAPLLKDRSHGAHDNAPRQAVSQEHSDAVKKLVKPLVADLIELQFLTGARSGELLMITPRMIDMTGDVWIAKLADHKTVHKDQARTLHFGPKCQTILARYLPGSSDKPIFGMIRTAYCRAITRACDKAGIPRWVPHQLRHTHASLVRQQFGLEHAQSVLGHSKTDMTETYAKAGSAKALEVAAKIG